MPGLISLPVFTLSPHLGGKAVPFSKAAEDARSARRGLDLFGMMFISIGLSMFAMWAWITSWFQWLLLGEVLITGLVYLLIRASLARTPWSSLE